MGGEQKKTISLSRGDVRQVTSRARCWADDCWKTNSLQNDYGVDVITYVRIRFWTNLRVLVFRLSCRFCNSDLVQSYGVLRNHSDSLLSEAILLLPCGRVVSVTYPWVITLWVACPTLR